MKSNITQRLSALNTEKLFLFKQFNRKILIDVPSGVTQHISDTAWDMLDEFRQTGSVDTVLQQLSSPILEQALLEIESKVHSGHICGPDIKTCTDDFCPNGIISVLLNLTHNCNLACKYCIMRLPELQEHYQAEKSPMTESTAMQAVDFIRSVSLPHVSLTFFGGEPLLEFPTIKKIVTYAEETYPGWFIYSIITNGTLLKPEMIDFFKQYHVNFLFSIDGNQSVNDCLRIYKHGTGSVFQDAFANLQELCKQAPELNYKVNITYFKQTKHIFESMKFFVDEDIAQTRYERGLVQRESPYAVTLEDIEEVKSQFSLMAQYYLERLLEGHIHVLDTFVILMKKIAKKTRRYRGCNMGIDYITIASNGDIYPCHKMVGDKTQVMGNVQEGLHNDTHRQLWLQNVLKRPKCKDCWAKFICGGFCISDNFRLNGDYFEPVQENCEIMQHNIQLAAWLYYELDAQAPHILKELLEDNYLMLDEIPYPNETDIETISPDQIKNKFTGAVYQLNPAAAKIFALCDGSRSIDEIACILTGSYPITPAMALSDVRSVVCQLIHDGILMTWIRE